MEELTGKLAAAALAEHDVGPDDEGYVDDWEALADSDILPQLTSPTRSPSPPPAVTPTPLNDDEEIIPRSTKSPAKHYDKCRPAASPQGMRHEFQTVLCCSVLTSSSNHTGVPSNTARAPRGNILEAYNLTAAPSYEIETTLSQLGKVGAAFSWVDTDHALIAFGSQDAAGESMSTPSTTAKITTPLIVVCLLNHLV
jgi:hypothetical protein